jgi:hypothetical protein
LKIITFPPFASADREASSRLGFDFAPEFARANEEAKSKA